MTIRIALVTESGSTAKTSTATSLACLLAERGQTVRLRDLDGQGDATQAMGWVDAPYVITDVLAQHPVFPDGNGGVRAPRLGEIEVPVWQADPDAGGQGLHYPPAQDWLERIRLIPSGISSTGTMLGDVTTTLATDPTGRGNMRLTESLTDDGGHPVDIEIYDTHGTKSPITYRTLLTVDWVLACVTPDNKATGRHLDELASTIAGMHEYNPRLQLGAVIPCRIKPARDGRFYTRIMDELRASDEYGELVTPTVREAVVVAEAFEAGEPLPLYVPHDPITKDVRAVLDWLDAAGITVAWGRRD
jgi:cellulose biosynthesis protein BcsQ